MSAPRLLVLSLLLSGAACLKAWDVGGPWACLDGGACAEGFTCDDGVCCRPGGEPACPTLPAGGACPSGLPPTTAYRDDDGDGAGGRGTGRLFCRSPVKESWAPTDTDCLDTDPAVGPLATERCNAADDDCDGVIDDGLATQAWYRDEDGDGFGDDCPTCRLEACAQPQGYAPRAGDCAPRDPRVFPGAPESCNGVDDNCNGPLDDPPFVDVENPGTDGGRFDCATGRPGTCAAGGLQCVYSASAAAFQKTCVARRAPAPDTCGNGLDEDCSGVPDDRPGCGGPSSFLTEPGLRLRALALPFDGGVPAGCLADRAGGEGMSWLSPSWIGTGVSVHVLSVEAAPGTWWDLSGATRVRLPLSVSVVGGASTPWGRFGPEADPIVQLCGDTDGAFTRYVPRDAGIAVSSLVSVPLHPGAGAAWTESNPGFDFSRVRRLELIVTPESAANVTFTLRFRTDAGVVGFE